MERLRKKREVTDCFGATRAHTNSQASSIWISAARVVQNASDETRSLGRPRAMCCCQRTPVLMIGKTSSGLWSACYPQCWELVTQSQLPLRIMWPGKDKDVTCGSVPHVPLALLSPQPGAQMHF